MKPAIFVDEADVASAEIAVGGEGCDVVLGAGAAITGRYKTAYLDHAGIAHGQGLAALRFDDADRDAGQRRSLRYHPSFEWHVVRRHATIAVDFRRAVDVADLRGAERHCRHMHLCGAADHQPGSQRACPVEVEARIPDRGAGDAGQGVDGSAPVPLYPAQPLSRVEPLLKHQGSAMRKCCRQGVGRPVRPEQRRCQKDSVIRR